MEKYIKAIGDSHRYKTKRGEISLLFPSPFTMYSFEIYCIEGQLFDGIERYDSLEEAENRIYELLEGAKQGVEKESELTSEQISRQDFVDNEIFNLVVALIPTKHLIVLDWNPEWIGEIRDKIQNVIFNELNLSEDKRGEFEMKFYPYIKEND